MHLIISSKPQTGTFIPRRCQGWSCLGRGGRRGGLPSFPVRGWVIPLAQLISFPGAGSLPLSLFGCRFPSWNSAATPMFGEQEFEGGKNPACGSVPGRKRSCWDVRVSNKTFCLEGPCSHSWNPPCSFLLELECVASVNVNKQLCQQTSCTWKD